MLRKSNHSTRYRESIKLLQSATIVDEYGHSHQGAPILVGKAWASVEMMSANRTMMTFQQADVIGVDIYLRNPNKEFNIVEWNGHQIVFAEPLLEERGRILRITGYYQKDR